MFFTSQRKNPKNSGYSLLEFAMVVPPILLFVMGALDVTRVLQAKQALQQGVETTLRCLYPVNGKCAQINHDPSTALLNWYRPTLNPIPVGEYLSYSAEADMITPPTYEISEYKANVFGPVEFDYTTHSLLASQAYYRATANITPGYLQIADSPVVRVNSSSDVDFAFANETGARYAPVPSTRLSFPGGKSLSLSISGNNTDSGTVRFIVDAPPNIDSSLPCFESTQFNKRTLNPNTEREASGTCANAISGKVPFVIWIRAKGWVEGTEEAKTVISGFSNLDVKNPNNQELSNIGGRKFDGNVEDDASFVPRGVGDDGDTKTGGYVEIAKYSKIEGKFGDKLELEFTLTRPDDTSAQGKATWDLTDIVVFAPKYKSMNTYQVECPQPVLLSDADDTNALFKRCGLDSNISAKQTNITIHSNEKAVTFDNQIVGGYSANPFPASAKPDCATLKESARENINCKDYVTTGFTSNKIHTQVDCPENYGKNAKKECPIQLDVAAKKKLNLPEQGSITNETWHKIEKTIPITPIRWVATDCDSLDSGKNTSEIPAEVRQYGEYWPGDAVKVETSSDAYIPVTMEDIDRFRTEKGYDCTQFENGPRLTLDAETADLKDNSFFRGHHYDIGCEWEAYVKDKAEKEKDKDGNLILRGAYAKNIVEVDSIEDRVSHAPRNDCTKFGYTGVNTISLKYEDMELLTPTPLAAPAIPEECLEKDVFCKSQLVSLNTEEETSFTALKDVAANIGYQEMQVSYPSFNYGEGCKSESGKLKKNCADIDVQEMDAQGYIPVTASIKVPLTSLFGNEIVLTHTDSERWEGAFAK